MRTTWTEYFLINFKKERVDDCEINLGLTRPKVLSFYQIKYYDETEFERKRKIWLYRKKIFLNFLNRLNIFGAFLKRFLIIICKKQYYLNVHDEHFDRPSNEH